MGLGLRRHTIELGSVVRNFQLQGFRLRDRHRRPRRRSKDLNLRTTLQSLPIHPSSLLPDNLRMSDVPITKSVIMFTVNYSHTERIGADIGLADVIAYDEEDVRPATRLPGSSRRRRGRSCCACASASEDSVAATNAVPLSRTLRRSNEPWFDRDAITVSCF